MGSQTHRAVFLLKKIPKGKVVSYKELARVCKTSPRAMGRIVAQNPDPLHYPCYKVVASDGKLCGYSGKGGLAAKKKLLEKEGIRVKKERVDQRYFYRFAQKVL